WGFFTATFIGAGYVSISLFALLVDTRHEEWGESDDGSIRGALVLIALVVGGYALAGAFGWEPEIEPNPHALADFPIAVAALVGALLTAGFAAAVWIRGLELRAGWVRNGWTKAVAVTLYALAGVIVFAGSALPALVLG